MTVAEWLRRNAHWHCSKEALVDGERRVTYGELNDRANRQAAALVAEGLVKGDRVAVVLNNSLEAVEALAAAAKGGFVHVPINVRLSAREVGEILRDSGTRVLLIDATYRDRLDGIGDCPKRLRTIIVEPGETASDYESWLAAHSADEGETATPEELIDFCRERLAHYKCPRQIDILPDLPKNALGKFLKSELRAPFWEGRRRGVN